jgi:MoaA/NifB/PqqE/SkfB family radical SAM enzyme
MSSSLPRWQRSALRDSMASYRRAQQDYCVQGKPFVELADGNRAFSLVSPPTASAIARRRVRLLVEAMKAARAEQDPGMLPLKFRIPHVVTIAVTYDCQCDCLHCSASEYRRQVTANRDALALEELQSAVGQMVELGTTCVIFSGGEPLLFPGIYDLVRSVDRSRCIATMFSNGEFLTAENVQRLKQAGLFGVYLSLDDPRPARHDAHRRRPGLFEKGVAGLKRCQDAGILTGISTYATRENIGNGDLDALMDLAKDLRVLEIFLFDIIPTGRLQGCFEHLLTEEDVDWLREFRARYNAEPHYPLIIHQTMLSSVGYPCVAEGCPAGMVYAHLRANGDVSPCDFCPHSFGNIRRQPFRNIWQTMTQSKLYRKFSPRCRLSQREYWTQLEQLTNCQ